MLHTGRLILSKVCSLTLITSSLFMHAHVGLHTHISRIGRFVSHVLDFILDTLFHEAGCDLDESDGQGSG